MSQTLNNNGRFTHEDAKVRFLGYMEEAARERGIRLGQAAGDQVRDLVWFLLNKTSWFTSPASTKYHLCVPGGLVIHSVAVTETALRLRDLLMPTIPKDSVILCGMMHDAGKIYNRVGENGQIVPRYEPNILKSGQRSEAAPYEYVKGANEISLTIKDLLIPMRFVDLSDAEMQAIMLADGQYVEENKKLQHNETPLGVILHTADYWEGHVVEGGLTADWLSGVFSRNVERVKAASNGVEAVGVTDSTNVAVG